MTRFFLTITLIIFANILPKNITLAQTIIKEDIYILNKKDYCNCNSGYWNLMIPKLSILSSKDIRNTINDSLNKIANSILKDTLNYSNNNNITTNCDCDTTSISFNPTEYKMHYQVGQNSIRILSLGVYIDGIAGGGGNGFGTDFHSFNVDITNNKLFLINDLLNATNTEKLKKYIGENIESPNEGISLDEDFNIFGKSENHPEYGSYKYVGFIIDNKNLILNYSYDYGSGNGINELRIPLTDIKSLINKQYLWLYKE